jgi:hypothetical protein
MSDKPKTMPVSPPQTRLATLEERFPLGCQVQLRSGLANEIAGLVGAHLGGGKVFVLWKSDGTYGTYKPSELARADAEANFPQQPKGGKSWGK